MKEFEKILDETEMNMDESSIIFAFVIMGLRKSPNIRIADLLKMKESFDEKYKRLTGDMPKKPMQMDNLKKHNEGMSRAERRAMERMSHKKVGSTKKKKK